MIALELNLRAWCLEVAPDNPVYVITALLAATATAVCASAAELLIAEVSRSDSRANFQNILYSPSNQFACKLQIQR